jgi:hypothetical protein
MSDIRQDQFALRIRRQPMSIAEAAECSSESMVTMLRWFTEDLDGPIVVDRGSDHGPRSDYIGRRA